MLHVETARFRNIQSLDQPVLLQLLCMRVLITSETVGVEGGCSETAWTKRERPLEITSCRAVVVHVLKSAWKGTSGSSSAASIVKEYHALN